MTPSPSRARRRTTALAAPVTLGLVLAGALTACSDDDALAVGAVVAAAVSTAEDGTGTSVTVLTGTLEMVISQSRQVGSVQAPDGGSLVRVSTTFRETDVRRDVWAFAARLGAAEPIELAVRVGGTEYPIGVVRRGSGPDDAETDTVPQDLVLAVDGELDDLGDVSVEVTYDGAEQTVSAADGEREAGVAAPLYDEVPDVADLPRASCDGSFDDAVTADVRCEVGAIRQLPYLPGQGWAPEGRTWTVVSLGSTVTDIESAPTAGMAAGSYTAAALVDRTTLDGEAPQEVVDEDVAGDGASYTSQLVFDTPTGPPGRLAIAFAYTVRLEDHEPGAPAPPGTRRVTYDATVELADLLPRT